MNGDELNDENILYLVGQTDKLFFEAGEDIRRRQFLVMSDVMRQLGYISYTFAGSGTPDIVKRINKAFSSIYSKHDLAMGGHIGVFMYRDIFARIGVPRGCGTVEFDPFEFVELTPVQKRMIQVEPDQMSIFIDQFCDVADIQYGSEEIKEPFLSQELTVRFIELSRLHIHAAAAVATSGYDQRGAVQSSLLSTELALKAGAAAQNLTENDIRERFGHKNKEIAYYVGNHWGGFDRERVMRVIEKQPLYVPNRYSKDQPKRVDVGHILMGAQYVLAEIIRQTSDRNFRSNIAPPAPRFYPA